MIELTGLQKVSGGNTVVDIKALTVASGEIVAVVGPPGSGKSALTALLTGQCCPTAGKVRVAGLDPAREREKLSRQMGVLFAENALYERLTARGNLIFYCELYGLPAARADEVLTEVGLADQAAVPACQLSPGLARRLAFGRAILHRPSVLLLHEPFAGCDASSCALLADLIRQLAARNTAILIFAAEATGLRGLCRTIYELEHGRIVRSYSHQGEQPASFPFRVPAPLEGKVVLVDPTDILYVSATGGHTCLHTVEGEIPTPFTLTELEERLTRSGFFRAHRAYLVNLQHVRAVIPYTRDSFTLVLDDSARTEIPLSKAAARELRELLGY
ncbi:MAG: LytTR family transcriptional regulator DNA-binding domain-containing protein [Anaerolineae bacterium]|nr:LytTR family transcriptional regulator DNA-binding domain-containing protein [Anaerolineae bacterium]